MVGTTCTHTQLLSSNIDSMGVFVIACTNMSHFVHGRTKTGSTDVLGGMIALDLPRMVQILEVWV